MAMQFPISAIFGKGLRSGSFLVAVLLSVCVARAESVTLNLADGREFELLKIRTQVIVLTSGRRDVTDFLIRKPNWIDDVDDEAAARTQICNAILQAISGEELELQDRLHLTFDNSVGFLFLRFSSTVSHEFDLVDGTCVTANQKN